MKTNTISYKYIQDEIPGNKTVKNIHNNAKMEFLKKCVGQRWYPNQLHVYGSPLNILCTLKYGKCPNTDVDVPTINMILQPCYSLDLKMRVCKCQYKHGIKQNYMYSENIT